MVEKEDLTPDNPFGWPLPITDAMLRDELLGPPLDTPAESLAERLVMLAHKSFSTQVWGGNTGRLGGYWAAFGDRIEGATRNASLTRWWETTMKTLPGVPLRNVALVHEKNLMIRPRLLSGTPVDDLDVLVVIQQHSAELRDRTRTWASNRRRLNTGYATEDPDTIVYDEPKDGA